MEYAVVLRRLALVTILIICLWMTSISLSRAAGPWPVVPPADLSKISLDLFTDEELEIPYYLAHFHHLANSMVQEGPNQGFFDIVVWRNPKDNRPYNARIMENIVSLAYFYSTQRPWNPYYKSEAVLLRLYAAIGFLERLQHDDGSFSEYGPMQWNLAGTGFSTLYLGSAMHLLQSCKGPGELINRMKVVDKKALTCVLNSRKFYEHGKNFSNQYTTVFAGALAYLSLFNDGELSTLLSQKMKQASADFQSPAGYFYESGGTDHGYNLNTHHSNMWFAYNYSRQDTISRFFVREEEKFTEWISYNTVREPTDGNIFTLNKGIEMRTPPSVADGFFPQTPLGEKVPLVRAFNLSEKEQKSAFAKKRKALASTWPDVGDMIVGQSNAYWPTYLLHVNSYHWYPTDAQKAQAVSDLPYIKHEQFVHQRKDRINPVVFTFIRRPGYYVSFNSGPRLSTMQRYGIGLVWHPTAGTLLQSQTSGIIASWGTRIETGKLYEADTLNADFYVDDKKIESQVGNHNLPEGNLSIRYKLGDRGEKTIHFKQRSVSVEIQHNGCFSETIPVLLKKGDTIRQTNEGIVISKAGTRISLRYDSAAKPSVYSTSLVSGEQKVRTIVLRGFQQLSYTLDFPEN